MITKEVIKSVRKAIGVTQSGMARKLLLSESIYNAYELGTRAIVEQARIQKALIDELRSHQGHCERLKLFVAGIKCGENPTNGG